MNHFSWSEMLVRRGKLIVHIRRWILVVLAVSLTFNLLLVGGYLYKRFVVYPQMQAEWATEALHLNTAQQAELQRFGEWARNEIKVAINDLRPDIATAKAIVREGKADDARLAESMRRISERRLKLQMDAMKKLFAFRDSLTPEQRQTFTRLSGERGFALRLIGLSPLAEKLPQ